MSIVLAVLAFLSPAVLREVAVLLASVKVSAFLRQRLAPNTTASSSSTSRTGMRRVLVNPTTTAILFWLWLVEYRWPATSVAIVSRKGPTSRMAGREDVVFGSSNPWFGLSRASESIQPLPNPNRTETWTETWLNVNVMDDDHITHNRLIIGRTRLQAQQVGIGHFVPTTRYEYRASKKRAVVSLILGQKILENKLNFQY